jgi:acetoacetate decarboxylase
MGFVKTPEEIAAIERAAAEPHFVSGERLTVTFLTDPETYRRLLPPPLEPAAEPLVVLGIGRWQSNCVGDYAGGSLSLAARHDGVEGGVAIAMWMDTEPAVAFGREVFGEPKKLARAELFRRGAHAQAWIERHGTRIAEISADLGDDLGPSETERVAFNYRSRTAADGVGLEGPAVLTATTFRTSIGRRREGAGSVTLVGTVHDPVDEIEVVSVVGAELQEHDLVARCEAVASVAPDEFLPFHYGRLDNALVLDTEACGWPNERASVSMHA